MRLCVECMEPAGRVSAMAEEGGGIYRVYRCADGHEFGTREVVQTPKTISSRFWRPRPDESYLPQKRRTKLPGLEHRNAGAVR